MIHDLSLSFAHAMDKKMMPFLKKWSGLARSANVTILFSGYSKGPGLRLLRLSTVFKQAQVCRWNLLMHSEDPNCRALVTFKSAQQAGWKVKFGPAYHLQELQAVAEQQMERDRLVRQPHRGLGCVPSSARSSSNTLSAIIRQVDMDTQISRLCGLAMQGAWSRWDELMSQDLTWNRLLHGFTSHTLKFLLNATTNTLPTPTICVVGVLKRSTFTVPFATTPVAPFATSLLVVLLHWMVAGTLGVTTVSCPPFALLSKIGGLQPSLKPVLRRLVTGR